MIVRRENIAWVYYIDETKAYDFAEHKVGKWMFFFKDKDFADRVTKLAVEEGAVVRAKRSNAPTGVCCFYLNCDDDVRHHKVLSFFLEQGLIPKTKSGRLYNISFKLDDQTLAGEYGLDFHSDIKLSNFVNLDTGKFLKGEGQ